MITIFCGNLSAHVIYLKQSSFSALVSCHCKRHFNPHGQVGSRNTNGTLYLICNDERNIISIWDLSKVSSENFWSTFMRIQTSDLPILLLMTMRIQTLDLKTSPSAPHDGQKKKFGQNICEDSNLIRNHYTILVRQSRKTTYIYKRIQTSDFAISVSNALLAELRLKCVDRPLVRNYT